MELGQYSYLFEEEVKEINDLYEATKPKLPDILKDPLGKAYSDSVISYEQKQKFVAAGITIPYRKLGYRDSRWLTHQKWASIMMQATPHGYNEFNPKRVALQFSKFGHLLFQGARVGSVCVYVKGFKSQSDLLNFLSTQEQLRADEVSIEKENGFPQRIGWDYSTIKKTLESLTDILSVNILNRVVVRLWWD
jgi:hypothetical protein